MVCEKKEKKKIQSKFVAIATNDGITFHYKYSSGLSAGTEDCREFAKLGFKTIFLEWQRFEESNQIVRRIPFCIDCNKLHFDGMK